MDSFTNISKNWPCFLANLVASFADMVACFPLCGDTDGVGGEGASAKMTSSCRTLDS
jgi:hypothetical protein